MAKFPFPRSTGSDKDGKYAAPKGRGDYLGDVGWGDYPPGGPSLAGSLPLDNGSASATTGGFHPSNDQPDKDNRGDKLGRAD